MKWIRFRKTTFQSTLDVVDLSIVALRRLWAVNFSRSIECGHWQFGNLISIGMIPIASGVCPRSFDSFLFSVYIQSGYFTCPFFH